MEKGNLRNSSSKTNSSEAKSKQDGGIKYNRFPRYKESHSPRPDAKQRPNPQKNREAFDKRPRTRSGAFCEKYRNEVVIDGVGVAKNYKQLSKNVNLNHLLNFTLAVPTDGRDFSVGRPLRSRGRIPKYNKELFLQANCQFVTREDGNYSLHSTNADLLVDWSLIEEIRMPSYELTSCPICLYPPVAAKITRCGHVYCWTCILHYLALTDRSKQKCPICFEYIQSADLKSVLLLTKKLVTVNNKLTLCLMKREKGSMFPLPAHVHGRVLSACRVSDDESITRYRKLLLASKFEVDGIIKRERKELEAQLLQVEEEEVCFVETALKLLQEREHLDVEENEFDGKKAIQDALNNDLNIGMAACSQVTEEPDEFAEQMLIESTRQQFGVYNSQEPGNVAASSSEGTTSSSSISVNSVSLQNDSGKKGKETFFFYQAEDGQHIYLHGLNVRMLVKEFGSLEDSPPVIEAKVLALEKISMSEDLRKRLRYLQHIPLTCEFQVAELHLGHILSKPTIDEFAGEILKRQKMRSQKAREERRRDKHIEIEEKKKFGRYPGPTYNLNSCDQFPVCDQKQDMDNADFRYFSSSPGSQKNGDYESEYPSFGNIGCSQSPPPATSFAQMLRDGQICTKNMHLGHRSVQNAKMPSNENLELCDDEGAVPEYHVSFSNSIQTALDAITINDKDNAGENATSSKKKKKLKKVLFTTSMCRSK